MLNRIKAAISDFLHIHPEEGVPEQVAKYFKHNVFVNTMDLAFFIFGDSFVSIVTIIPYLRLRSQTPFNMINSAM